MNQALSMGLLAGGIMLMAFGISEMNSVTSDISRVFTGAPTDRAIWMMVGAVALLGFGLAGLIGGPRKK